MSEEKKDTNAKRETEPEKIEDVEAAGEEVIRELVEGSTVFESSGYVRLKLTTDGVSRFVKVPIRTIDSENIQEFLKGLRPKPRNIRQPIKPNTDEAARLHRLTGVKINTIQWVQLQDLADPDFIEAQDLYNIKAGYVRLLHGLDLNIKNKKGKVVWDKDKVMDGDIEAAIDVLQGMGFTEFHFVDIIRAVNSLTHAMEDEEGNGFAAPLVSQTVLGETI